jgi:hypothetical protein
MVIQEVIKKQAIAKSTREVNINFFLIVRLLPIAANVQVLPKAGYFVMSSPATKVK